MLRRTLHKVGLREQAAQQSTTTVRRRRKPSLLDTRFEGAGPAPRWVGAGGPFWVGRSLVKWNAESDLHVPASHPNFFDDQSQQLLALIEIQSIEAGDDTLSEAADAPTKPISCTRSCRWAVNWSRSAARRWRRSSTACVRVSNSAN